MSDSKKTVIEEGQGVAGFLIPEQVLPSKLADYFGYGSELKMTVKGSMVKIEDEVFFKVSEWQLGLR